MPEGPELHLASLFVNRVCEGVIFTGQVRKSEVSKCPDVPFTCEAYRITATSRGKEVRLTLSPIKNDESKGKIKARQADKPMDIVFRFGMSGFFRFTTEEELPKHAHLRFYSNEKPCRVLSFVDARRFGSWQPNGTWQVDRGPCVLFDYKSFRKNIMSNLSDRAFDRPICEVLLNQKYFNGIGNYLRAEILYRLNIPPFVQSRSVLEGLQSEDVCEDEKEVKAEKDDAKHVDRKKADGKTSDLLELCHTVPLEVVKLGGKGYDPEKKDYSDFEAWLQCYYVDGMKSIRDHNGRTMWFSGDPGPMAPKDTKSPKAKKRVNKDDEHDYTVKRKAAKSRSNSTRKENPNKREREIKKPQKARSPLQKETRSRGQLSEKNYKKAKQSPKRSAARKGSATKTDTVTKRRSGRVTRQSSK